MRAINILYYEPSSGYGGSSRCLLGWLQHLNKEKFNPVVITLFNGPVIKKIKESGIEVIKLPYLTLIKKLSLLYGDKKIWSFIIFFMEAVFNILPISIILAILILFKKIKLMEINSSISTGIPAILAAQITKTLCICHIHDTRKLTKKEILLGKWVDRFIVLTNVALKLYSPELKAQKFSTIYNGLNFTEWNICTDSSKIKESYNLNNYDTIIGMVGRITRGKGHEDFIAAAKIISNIKPKAKFLIVGSSILIDAEWENQLKNSVKKLGLAETVIFTGWKENMPQMISSFDMLVFPSSTFPEGFGLTCIEAMALNKPVIATNIPGPSEIILDGITGFLVPPGSPEVLAEKIINLIDNPELAKNMGLAGRARVEEFFDNKKLTEEIENLYSELLAQKGL